jgi:hypothetical protein
MSATTVEEPKAPVSETKQGVGGKQANGERKPPEVVIKKATKPDKPAKPKLNATTAKRLAELTVEIERLEGLKRDRLNVMKKAHSNGVAITEIAAAAGYSVARARQLLSK